MWFLLYIFDTLIEIVLLVTDNLYNVGIIGRFLNLIEIVNAYTITI